MTKIISVFLLFLSIAPFALFGCASSCKTSAETTIAPGTYVVQGSERQIIIGAWKYPRNRESDLSPTDITTVFFNGASGFYSQNSVNFPNYEWGYVYTLDTVDSIYINGHGQFRATDGPQFASEVRVIKVAEKRPVEKDQCFVFEMGWEYDEVAHKPSVEEFLDLFKPNEVVFKNASLRMKLAKKLKAKNWGVKMCFLDMPTPRITIVSVEKSPHVTE